MREPDALDDAVARADLFRSRQAAFGPARHPEALRFAASVVTRDGRRLARRRGRRPAAARHPAVVVRRRRPDRALQSAPSTAWRAPPVTLTCSESAFHRFSPVPTVTLDSSEPTETPWESASSGSARSTTSCPSSRWSSGTSPGARRVAWTAPGPRSWSAWRASGPGASTSPPASLARSDTLEELYRDVGLDADDPQRGGVERRQADALRAALAGGRRRTPTTTSSCTCPATCCSAAGPRSSGRPTAPRCASSASCATSATAQRQAQRFADLMTVMPGGVAVLDPAGRIVAANPGLCALLGAPAERLRGMAVVALAAEPPIGGLPELAAARCRPAPSTATASTPRRCCGPTAPPSGASWTWRARPPRTAARSG